MYKQCEAVCNSMNSEDSMKQCSQCKQCIAWCSLHLWWYFLISSISFLSISNNMTFKKIIRRAPSSHTPSFCWRHGRSYNCVRQQYAAAWTSVGSSNVSSPWGRCERVEMAIKESWGSETRRADTNPLRWVITKVKLVIMIINVRVGVNIYKYKDKDNSQIVLHLAGCKSSKYDLCGGRRYPQCSPWQVRIFPRPGMYVAKYFLSGREQSILGDVALMEDWVTLRRRVTDTFTGNVVWCTLCNDVCVVSV